jgi:hypothetical protein
MATARIAAAPLAFVLGCTSLVPGTVHALDQRPPLWLAQAGVPWSGLSPAEQEVLGKHRERWADYPAGRRDELLRGARRYLELTPGERNEAIRGQEQYRQMTPEQRQRLREEYRQQKQVR